MNLLKNLAEKRSKMQIYQMLLESNASEQSSKNDVYENAGRSDRRDDRRSDSNV